MKLRKGDTVKVIAGNSKGKQGKITAVFVETKKIIVEGVNLKKKHVRPRQQGRKGEMVQMPAAFAMSNVMLVCSKCGKPTRSATKGEEGKKYRTCKKCGAEI